MRVKYTRSRSDSISVPTCFGRNLPEFVRSIRDETGPTFEGGSNATASRAEALGVRRLIQTRAQARWLDCFLHSGCTD